MGGAWGALQSLQQNHHQQHSGPLSRLAHVSLGRFTPEKARRFSPHSSPARHTSIHAPGLQELLCLQPFAKAVEQTLEPFANNTSPGVRFLFYFLVGVCVCVSCWKVRKFF